MAKEQGFFVEEGLDVEVGAKYVQIPRDVAEQAYNGGLPRIPDFD